MPTINNLADILVQQVRKFEDEKPKTARAYEKIVKRLLDANSGSTAPKTGTRLPSFLLPDENGKLQNLENLLESGPLVISLNRGHWCAFCQHELDALQAITTEIRALGGNIIAITPECQQFAKRMISRRKLDFPVLCDIDNGYALLLGLAIWCGEEVKSIYAERNIDVGLYQNNSQWLLPIPATLIVSTDGTVAGSYINADFRYRMAPQEILGILRNEIQANA